jgi:hypothetical protein
MIASTFHFIQEVNFVLADFSLQIPGSRCPHTSILDGIIVSRSHLLRPLRGIVPHLQLENIFREYPGTPLGRDRFAHRILSVISDIDTPDAIIVAVGLKYLEINSPATWE